MTATPTRFTETQRRALALRAAGWGTLEIAAELDVAEETVRRIFSRSYRTMIPGVTDGPEPAKGYRLVYVLGLLDGGVPPAEIPARLAALVDRARQHTDRSHADP